MKEADKETKLRKRDRIKAKVTGMIKREDKSSVDSSYGSTLSGTGPEKDPSEPEKQPFRLADVDLHISRGMCDLLIAGDVLTVQVVSFAA